MAVTLLLLLSHQIVIINVTPLVMQLHFTLNGVAGQAIHTVTTVNALLYSGETVTVS